MNIYDTPEQARLRAEIRAWIARDVPAPLKGRSQELLADQELTRAEWASLVRALDAKGWTAPAWPKAHGGAGFDVGEMIVFNEEWVRAGLPLFRSDGLDKIGPILTVAGSPAQQQRFLKPTRLREMFWAQGYSEPGAGSDLASLALSAERADGGFVLNGSKIWTSGGHHADWLFVLARTDKTAVPRHAGISLLMLDAHSPGVRITPIVSIDGFHHFNQTFFDGAFVPADQVVGGVNDGWKVSNVLLGHERFSDPVSNPMYHEHALGELKRCTRQAASGELAVWHDPGFRRRVAELEMDTDCLRYTRYRVQSQIARTGSPGPEVSVLKLFGSELLQQIVELHQLGAGPAGMAWEVAPFGADIRNLVRRSARVRAHTIAAGTKEIQRNIVARRILGLPN
ncbi:MAG: acyl-CoA dehydrogenase family protein [Candidatus Lambdaproteobacteria bacterium]|nr:acyl-CoA dehydrogenase family protein [Candidatus Lambdaproteobacteria bacterium]